MSNNLYITKRGNYYEPFNRAKIVAAVTKAMIEVDEIDMEKVDIIANSVEFEVKNMADTHNIFMGIEEIQDTIEGMLMSLNLKKTAKAFILYREQRAKKREEGWKLDELQQSIFDKKYRYKGETFDQFLARASGGNKQVEKLMRDKKFLFGGRILAHRGIPEKVTYSNCYVMPPVEDNIEDIFDSAKRLARTYSYGGGCGLDISKLRPKGAKVNNSAKETSGATSFMQLYDLTTALIGQNGRRGALMLSMDVSHPDIMEFIDIKTQPDSITKANISIRVSDEFMQAVNKGHDWELKWKGEDGSEFVRAYPARDIFRKNCENNYDWAEAGMLYWDTISNWHLMSEHQEHEYAGVNPCAEEPLMPYGSCLIGALNLSEFVCSPYTPTAKFDWLKFREAVRTATTGLNEVLVEGYEKHPLQGQRDNAKNWRQIGLGIMGLADMLIKLGIVYGSDEAQDLSMDIGVTLLNEAVYQSARLAEVYGAFPMYDKEALLKSQFYQTNITDEVKEVVEKYGLFNSQLLTIAPTGTLSTMLGISGGIEPLFAVSYERTTQSLYGKDVKFEVFAPTVKELMAIQGIEDKKQLPSYVVTAHDIDWFSRIMMQSKFQFYIDAAISSTVNLPNDATVEDIESLYMVAWGCGLKGVTIFRDGCKRAGILNVKEEEDIPDTSSEVTEEPVNSYSDDSKYKTCSNCGATIEVIQGACAICMECGHSGCG